MKKIMFVLLSALTTLSFAAQPQPKHLTVLLDGELQANHAPLIIAEQQGYFKEQGLDVAFVSSAPDANIRIMSQPQLLKNVDQGLPLVRIGTLIDKPLNCVVALKDSGIKTLADLKGKRIAASNDSLTAAMLKTVLTNQGLSGNDIALTPTNTDLTEALLTNKVSAITAALRNVDVPRLELQDRKAVAFFLEDHGVPSYNQLIFAVNKSAIHDKRFPRFLAAIKKAVRYLDEHPQQAWLAYINTHPEANTALNRDIWFATIPYFAEDPANFNPTEWHHFAQYMEKNQLIMKAQPISNYAVIIR